MTAPTLGATDYKSGTGASTKPDLHAAAQPNRASRVVTGNSQVVTKTRSSRGSVT